MRAGIAANELVVCDGQRPIGAIVPRGGRYEAHLADGSQLGSHDTVQAARLALIAADRERRG